MLGKVVKYSHYFTVTINHPRLGQALLGFMQDEFLELELVCNRGKRRMVPKRMWCRRSLRTGERAFNINSYNLFLSYIAKYGIYDYNLDISEVKPGKAKKVKFDAECYTPYPEQVPLIEHACGEHHQYAITATPGFGKALTLDSLIRVPGGWVRMGDIAVGDTVTTPLGWDTVVTAVYPQGVVPVYRILLADGRSVEACNDHTWCIQVEGEPSHSLLSTSTLRKLLDNDVTVSIPLVYSTKDPYVNLPIDPYKYGQDLLTYGVRIPNVYLNSHVRQRQALLDGILSVSDTKDVIIVDTYALANSIQKLVWSLGLIAYVESIEDNRHTVTVVRGEKEIKISSITYVGNKPAQCITVKDKLHLYITNDYIVTHNTLCALLSARQIGLRFAVVTRSSYASQWVTAMENVIGLTKDEIRLCCGAKAIEKLVKEHKDSGLANVKAIFFSIGGLRSYIKNYEKGAYKKKNNVCRNVPPERLFNILEIGFKIVDEAHQEIHAHYILDLYTNVKHSLYLTGTLFANTGFMNKIYDTFLPRDIRKSNPVPKIYAEANEVVYRLNDPDDAKYMGPKGYSHILYEKWIMRNPKRLHNWIKMLFDYVYDTWVSKRTEPTKALIFCSTIELPAKMCEYFKLHLPELNIVQYKAGDSHDYLLNNDIIFATLIKAGTAVDIPSLEAVYMTTSMESGNGNVQAFGRLRELKAYPNITPQFHWFVCANIEKQIEYSRNKKKLLEKRILRTRLNYINTKV